MSTIELKQMQQLIEELDINDLFDDLDAGICSVCCTNGGSGSNGNAC